MTRNFRRRVGYALLIALLVHPRPGNRPGAHAQTRAESVAQTIVGHAPVSLDGSATRERWGSIADTVFQQLSSAKGLPNTTTVAVEEDAVGFLWTGTSDGLARWDGYRFRTYRSNSQDPGSLRDSFVQVLHTDPAGRLWVGTAAGGLARYDALADNFVQYPVGGSQKSAVAAIVDDGKQGLWVGGSFGLAHLDRSNLAGASPSMPDGASGSEHYPGLPAGRVRALLLDRDGTLWVGGARGLFQRRRNDAEFTRVAVVAADEPPPASIQALLQDGAGRIWLGTATGGVYVVGAGNAPGRQVIENDLSRPAGNAPNAGADAGQALPLLQTLNVQALVEARPGEIWAATIGYGIAAINVADLHTRRMRHDPRLPTSLADDTVFGLHRDRAGAVWAATARGLSRTDPQQNGIATMFGSSERADGLSDSDVTDVSALPDGRIWAGLLHKGADLIDPVLGRVGQVRPGPIFPNAIVASVAATPSGDVFIGTWRGLFRVDSYGRNVKRINIPPLAPTSTLSSSKTAVEPRPSDKTAVEPRLSDKTAVEPRLSDKTAVEPQQGIAAVAIENGKLWISAADELYGLDLDAPAGTPPHREQLVGTLSDPRIRVFAPAPNGRLWIGTWNGLNLLDPATHRVVPVPLGRSGPVSSPVVTLLTDNQHRLWVGTDGGGIDILEVQADGSTRVLRKLTTANGLPNDTIDKLLQDRSGRIWASTDDGLAQIDRETFAIRTLHEEDGVAITSNYGNSGAVTAMGELVFGGAGGLTIVRPDAVVRTPYYAPLVVTDIRVGGKAVPPGRFNVQNALPNGPLSPLVQRQANPAHPAFNGGVFNGGIFTSGTDNGSTMNRSGQPAPVVVEPGANSLAVEFAALDFTGPDRNRYAYRLQGFDRDWLPTDPSRRLAAYTDLPPGRYTLRLRISEPEGKGGDRFIAIPVLVVTAWYQTTWFSFLTAAFTLLAASIVVRLSTLLLRRRQRELEQLVKQRTGELSLSNEALIAAAQTLRDLGTIGQELTANLDKETVFAVFYQHVQTTLDAPFFAIYLIDEQDNALDLRFAMLDGQPVSYLQPGLEHADIHAARAASTRSETEIEDAGRGLALRYSGSEATIPPDEAVDSGLAGNHPDMQSLLCVPLIVTDRVIGVVCIQSRAPYAYGENEKLILRTISAYGAIALSNAMTLAALARMKSQLQHLAYSDGLTDLPNRRMYVEHLSRMVAAWRRHRRPFTLLLVDIDRFKQVNDNFGHDAGDALLVIAAARLKAALRDDDFLTRLGGDEFAILLDGIADEHNIAGACMRIASNFAEQVQWEGMSFETTVSVGAAVFPTDGDAPESLYKAADIALYEAKRNGRNMWRIAGTMRLGAKEA